MFVGRTTWMNGCGNSDRENEYVSRKQCHMNNKYVDGIECMCNGEKDGEMRDIWEKYGPKDKGMKGIV